MNEPRPFHLVRLKTSGTISHSQTSSCKLKHNKNLHSEGISCKIKIESEDYAKGTVYTESENTHLLLPHALVNNKL
jgi:hypothetical protein